MGLILDHFEVLLASFSDFFLNSVPEVEKVNSETGKVDFLSLGDPENNENNLGILGVS